MEDLTGTLLGRLLDTSYKLLDTAHKLQAPETLPVPETKDNAVDVARKTLRWLRNLQHLSQDMENWLRIGNLPEQQTKAQWLQNLITIYAGQVKIAQLSNPGLLNHFTIDHANHAAGSLALSISLHTLEILPDANPAIAILDEKLDSILPQWDHRQSQGVEQLIDAIESGLTHLVNKPLGDRSPVDRLIEVSNNLQEAVRQLYSIDTLEDPAREESIELAREILRRLKDLSFSDKPIEEAIGVGRPNEKLAFAQRLSEMVNMYKNLLFEAMRINPDIVNDVRVKNANDAASYCSHSVQLLASKEIPIDSVSIKQISMDLENVDYGKKFENSSINRIMNKMEGGLEQAVEEVSFNKEQEQKQKTAQKVEEIAQSEGGHRHRRRRRRRHHHQATKSGPDAAQMANTNSRETVKSSDAKNVGTLNNLDIAAVRQAGNSLRKSNRQANDMLSSGKNLDKNTIISSASNVSATTKIKPDDKGFSTRERDGQNNPRNNRPRIG